MYVVTAEEMRRIDRHTIDSIGIPAMVLMENAGRAIAEEVLASIAERRLSGQGVSPADRQAGAGCGKEVPPVFSGVPRYRYAKERWLVLAGKGNNGGDGFVAARHLLEAGVEAEAALALPVEQLEGEARQQAEMAARFGVPCFPASKPEAVPWHRYTGIVDALLGTGTQGAPREPYAGLIRAANESGLPIVAADIPSGLCADTGAVHDPCIRAERTVALAFLKRGLMQYPGAEAAGRVTVRAIGIPSRLAEEFDVRVTVADEEALAERLGLNVNRKRRTNTHKGTYGHVLAAVGSEVMSGAGILCVKSALRGGCGLATWAVPGSLAPSLIGLVPEAMLAPLPDSQGKGWSGTDPLQLAALAGSRDVLVAGPGMGRWQGDTAWLRTVWQNTGCPLVLDADALNMLADAPDFASWPRRGAPTVLTPHPGEMARLAGLTTAEVQADRIGLAQRFAQEHGITLVLKGARTLTAAANGDVWINVTGNPGMATGGAGDVLAGVIASLLAQGHSAEQAAAFGVYLHGAAGDRAAAARSSAASLIAGDIVEAL